MFRLMFLFVALAPLACSQNLPAFQWIKQVDTSGSDSFAGLGVDALGNTYLAGSTYSATFPVQAAAQNHLASDGLYRIDGTGSAYAPLGLTSASFVAVDPQNPNTLYAISANILMKSKDGGATFTPLSLPSTFVLVLAIHPTNDQILYAGTFDQGLFKSTDGGATWAASNGSLQALQAGEFEFQSVWIDPTNPSVLLAYAIGNFIRSSDGGASWQTIFSDTYILSATFDTANPGVVYAVDNQGNASKSTDHGQTFAKLATPGGFGMILPDPNHPGRLVASSPGEFYESDDGGATWTKKLNLGFQNFDFIIAADWVNGFIYTGNEFVVRITADLQSFTTVGPPSVGSLGGIAAANGHAYVAFQGTRDVYVTKLDPSGNIVYSTYFGGTGDDVATAIAVDRSGNVYVTGTTTSLDFPVTKGTYASTGGSFVFKLNPDGSLGYSTYFAPAGNTPGAIAVDASGSVYLAGSSGGTLPVTPGAYQPDCNCGTFSTGFFVLRQSVTPKLAVFSFSGFVSKLDPTAATLLYSTYIGQSIELENVSAALAVGSDGTAYVGTPTGIFRLNAAGSALLGSLAQAVGPNAMAFGPDGNLYVAGQVVALTGQGQFQATAGAFQTTLTLPQQLPDQGGSVGGTAIAKIDPQLAGVLAATYVGAVSTPRAIALDAAGDVYIGGSTAQQGLPARTPLQEGFASNTGFVSEISGDLSTLLFSSYFGDAQAFAVSGLAVRSDRSVVLGGVTGLVNNASGGPPNIWVNSLTLGPPPALRIDAVVNAASFLDGSISAGESMVVQGTGFGSGAQLSIGGAVVPSISVTSTAITAVVPQNVPAGAADVQVESGGGSSNAVLVQVTPTAPGIFSQNGSGGGQGYIINNKTGTLNTPSNPAAPGDPITIFATGVGPETFTEGYAVTQFPVNVFIDGFFCNGIAAIMGPVPGLPGSVFQIGVYVPNPATLVSANPNLAGFVFPPLDGVIMQIDGQISQNGISISISR